MILIHCSAKMLLSGKRNAKNWPHWGELVSLIKEPIIQVGVNGEERFVDDFRVNCSYNEIKDLIAECRVWIDIDSFLQHAAHYFKKPGVVIWGPSDPLIWGHTENKNLLKSRKYLRPNQHATWEECDYSDDCWVSAKEVYEALNGFN